MLAAQQRAALTLRSLAPSKGLQCLESGPELRGHPCPASMLLSNRAFRLFSRVYGREESDTAVGREAEPLVKAFCCCDNYASGLHFQINPGRG